MKKYDAKYFGAAAGVLSIIIFLLVVFNILLSSSDELISRLIPFIPFMTSVTFFTVLGGIIVSFLWGFFLGYLFITVYNFYDSLFADKNNKRINYN